MENDAGILCNNFDKLGELESHLIRHRELFLSRQIETYKIDMVRGKCTVSLLNELEDIHTYLDKEDTFFFTMVYDPNQKTLLVDKGEIRVGTDYQAEISPYVDLGMCGWICRPRPGYVDLGMCGWICGPRYVGMDMWT